MIRAILSVLVLSSVAAAQEGPWPEGMEFPRGMVKYAPARNTQRLAITNGSFSTDKSPRTSIKYMWQVPGGLARFETVDGFGHKRKQGNDVPKSLWRSDLYKIPGLSFQLAMGAIPVWNGSYAMVNYGRGWQQTSDKTYQTLRGWIRSYPDGMKFMDVLSNRTTGKVFEIRVAEKVNGRWNRFVDYRDADQRPAGYVYVRSKQCVECHKHAGTGGNDPAYASGLVPGGDHALSHPIAQLE